MKVQSSVNFSMFDVRCYISEIFVPKSTWWNLTSDFSLISPNRRGLPLSATYTGVQRADSPLKITYSSLSSWNNQVNYNYQGASLFSLRFTNCPVGCNLDMDNEDEFHNNLWALTDNWKQIYQSAWKDISWAKIFDIWRFVLWSCINKPFFLLTLPGRQEVRAD